MATRADLKHSIIIAVKHNRDGSYKTQANRKERLLMMADQLINRGYKIRHIKQLKYKHVKYLVDAWLQQKLGAGTIKNRMTDLRWIMNKFGLNNIIPASNDALNIPKRQYVTNKDKSPSVMTIDLSKITDENVKMSLILQREFGLRREESIKIRLNQAVVGDKLHLKKGWCKNGRSRVVKIIYPEQWQAIEQVKAFLGSSQRALIPHDKKYIQQQNKYDNELKQAGINNAHGLRHAYTQKRYFDLTGWPCPAKGGPIHKELTSEQIKTDRMAREIISQELGHERTEVLSIYCGK